MWSLSATAPGKTEGSFNHSEAVLGVASLVKLMKVTRKLTLKTNIRPSVLLPTAIRFSQLCTFTLSCLLLHALV